MAINKTFYRSLAFIGLIVCFSPARAQQTKKIDRCGTVQVLELALKRDPTLKKRLELQELQLQKAITQRSLQSLRTEAVITIPVVFHIVLPDPNVVSNAQVQAQVDTLNTDFGGRNSDSVLIPAAFKALFGKSNIQFTLARRTPDDEPTNGIERSIAGKSSYATTDNSLKYTALGGADAWDPSRYFNVWLCDLSGGILGYGTPPGSSVSLEQGVAILFSSLPGGSSAPYDLGRTLTHETGHYFNLIHIWGDDDGLCTGTDNIGDTPNQTDATFGCPGTAVKTDACTPAAPGILYQDYMDYTDDACMHLFTKEQVTRMESALNILRTTLLTSNGAQPVILKNLDAELKSITQPVNRVCSTSIVPQIVLRNRGVQTLTAVTFNASVDNGPVVTTSWTGALVSLDDISATLQAMTITEGTHTLKVYTSNPNGGNDENKANDTLTTTFEYHAPVSPPLTEGFEGSTFPPAGWDIVNPDHLLTWERVTGIAKTGNASVVMRNLAYQTNGPKDYLRLPLITIANVDSAFLTFQVAAGVQTNTSTANNLWDTLEVVASFDCGKTYTSIYKKWGANLVTRTTPTAQEFVPTSSQWRKDSVNLTPYVNAGPVMLAFVNTTEFENNIYLDDINIYESVLNANLKEKGFLVTPNPTSGRIAVQFFPNPANLKGISIYNAAGQRVAQRLISGSPSTRYEFDLSAFAKGVYIVQAVFSNKKVTAKVVKN
jgi:Pregnancy-associated plasma protein-A/Secretion system C-terminal sorting domain